MSMTPTETGVPEARARRGAARAVVLGAAIVAAVAVVFFSPARAYLQDAGRLREALAGAGAWAYPACVLAVAAGVMCGLPRLLFCTVAGMVLGFGWGLALTTAGTVLGYYAVFGFVRWVGREAALRRWPRLRGWAAAAEHHGVAGVLLARQVPVHGAVINVALGLSNVRHWQFLVGTAVGLMPEAVPVTLIGAGLVSTSAREMTTYLAIAAVAFAALWVGAAYGLRAMRRGRGQGSPEC